MKKISINDIHEIDLTGKVICFPTDTVYGVGAMIADKEAIEKTYNLKNRDKNEPLAVLSPSSEAMLPLVKRENEKTRKLMTRWPGALTIIFEKSEEARDYLSKDLKTIGIRIPDSEIALAVLNNFGVLATTSVNISGSAALNDKAEIERIFNDKIDYMIVEEEKKSGISSTVVMIKNEDITVLRQGSIDVSDI